MKRIRKIVSILLTAAMILGCNSVSFAAEENRTDLPIIHDRLEESLIRGADRPSSSAETVDLSQNSYSYEVTDMGYRVYTNKWLTGAEKIHISVSNWTLLDDYGGEDSELTIAVYDSGNQVAAKNTIEITWSHEGTGYGGVDFAGLNANERYYVLFEVPTNSNRYSFDGLISKK